MDFMTAKQAADEWGVSLRWVQTLCRDGRVPGALRFGRDWMIPKDAQKPDDPRREKKPKEGSQ